MTPSCIQWSLNNRNILITNFYLSGNKMFVIQMLVLQTTIQILVRYSNGGLNTRLNLVRYSNGIQIPEHSTIGQLLTIPIPDYSGIQTPTVRLDIILHKVRTIQVYYLFQDLWNKFLFKNVTKIVTSL